MTPEQYTDDAVCFAMGLGQFVPLVGRDVLRVVCRPSFHPEVCVTLTPDEIVTVALQSQLWHEPIPARMPELSERAPLSSGEFETIRDAFASALEEASRPPERVVICDGMAASAVRVCGEQTERFSGHAASEAESQFVTKVMSLALSRTSSIPLRNRISWCGQYATRLRDDPAFPTMPEPVLVQSPVSRLLVLGTPADRADFHQLTGARPATRPPE